MNVLHWRCFSVNGGLAPGDAPDLSCPLAVSRFGSFIPGRLIVSGSAYLLIRLGYTWVHDYLRIFWPVIVVALGVEILWRQWRLDWFDGHRGQYGHAVSRWIGVVSAVTWGAGSGLGCRAHDQQHDVR